MLQHCRTWYSILCISDTCHTHDLPMHICLLCPTHSSTGKLEHGTASGSSDVDACTTYLTWKSMFCCSCTTTLLSTHRHIAVLLLGVPISKAGNGIVYVYNRQQSCCDMYVLKDLKKTHVTLTRYTERGGEVGQRW